MADVEGGTFTFGAYVSYSPVTAFIASCMAMCTIARTRPWGGPAGNETLRASRFQSCTTSACARVAENVLHTTATTTPVSVDRMRSSFEPDWSGRGELTD